LRLATVVLAAGKSSRMGVNKLLLRVGKRMVIEHILFSLEPIETIVVLGHRPDEIRDIIETQGIRTVHNPDYERGMTTSFQAGLMVLDPGVEAVFMVLSDIFGFSHELLERMARVMEEDSEALIVSPVYEGRRGHPVLFRRHLFEEFLGLEEGKTVKDIVNCHEDQHLHVEADVWCTVDLDTLEDYERIMKIWEEKRASV
jgi:molybdenum cofactor cytidylyltransferase